MATKPIKDDLTPDEIERLAQFFAQLASAANALDQTLPMRATRARRERDELRAEVERLRLVIDSNRWPDTAAKLLRDSEAEVKEIKGECDELHRLVDTAAKDLLKCQEYAATVERQRDQLRTALGLILDSVDYTSGACGLTERVGAALPVEIISRAKAALNT